jgi:hypothetical protein
VAHCYYIAPKAIKTTREFVIDNLFAGVFSVPLTLNPAGTISPREEAENALREEAASTRVNSVRNDDRRARRRRVRSR